MDEDAMMSFIRTHIESILKPYAENVQELHKTVLDLASNVCELQEKSAVFEQYAARVDVMKEEQDKLTQLAESTRQSLDGFIDASGKIDQERATAIQNLEENVTQMKSDMEEARKNAEDTHTKLVACQDAEKENRGTCVQLNKDLQNLADNLKQTDETLKATIKKVDYHKGQLDTEIIQNKELNQEQRYLRAKFIALNDESTDKLKAFQAGFEESQSRMKQYRKEFEQMRDDASQFQKDIKDELGLVQKEAQAKLQTIETEVMSNIHDMQTKASDLDFNLNKLLRIHCERQREEMQDHKAIVEEYTGRVSKWEEKFNALETATGVLPQRVAHLEEEQKFTDKKVQRLEKFCGLEPLTKMDVDPKRGLKKRASSAMLGEDQTLRKAWSAWTDAIREEKQNSVVNSLPAIQERLKEAMNVIESEKSKLGSTNEQVQKLELDHTHTKEEVHKLRKSVDLNDGYWKGMTRGLQAAKSTMHKEGDGEMVPSATKLRNALPSLAGSPTSRPGSSLSYFAQ